MTITQRIAVSGICANRRASAYGSGLLLEALQLVSFEPGPAYAIRPGRARRVTDGVQLRQPGIQVQTTATPPSASAITLPTGHLFRLVTNAELLLDMLWATACQTTGFGHPESINMVAGYNIQDAIHRIQSILMPPLEEIARKLVYADVERSTAQPVTVAWHSLESALAVTARERIFLLERHDPLGRLLRTVGLDVSEVVLLAIAIDVRRLTRPLHLNLNYGYSQEPNRPAGIIVNEAIPLDALRIVAPPALIACDSPAALAINDELVERRTAGKG